MEAVMRELNSPLMKVAYVAGVTTFCTFLGCWAVLAHQENSPKPARSAVSDAQFAKKAAQENITLPDDVSAKDKATYDALSKLSGAAFDRAYARDMVKDHEQDVADFNKEANGGQKPAVKDFASQTLPTLQDHLKQ